MKTQGVVLSLAVADTDRSGDFYTAVFGTENVQRAQESTCLELPGITVFLADVAGFSKYSREAKRTPLLPVPATDALLSCAVASVGEVDEVLSAARDAGGRVFDAHEIPHATGRLQYVGTFADPDGHLWQLVCNLSDPQGVPV